MEPSAQEPQVRRKKSRTHSVYIHQKVALPTEESGYTIELHRCTFNGGLLDDGEPEKLHGYRFMWRGPNGNLQSFRGQARLSSREDIMALIAKGDAAGLFI